MRILVCLVLPLLALVRHPSSPPCLSRRAAKRISLERLQRLFPQEETSVPPTCTCGATGASRTGPVPLPRRAPHTRRVRPYVAAPPAPDQSSPGGSGPEEVLVRPYVIAWEHHRARREAAAFTPLAPTRSTPPAPDPELADLAQAVRTYLEVAR